MVPTVLTWYLGIEMVNEQIANVDIFSAPEPPMSPVKPATILPQKSAPQPEPYVLVPVEPSQVTRRCNF